jgi:hypothetical protein
MMISVGAHGGAVGDGSLLDGQRVCFVAPLNNLGANAYDPREVGRQLLGVARLFDDGANPAFTADNAEFFVHSFAGAHR